MGRGQRLLRGALVGVGVIAAGAGVAWLGVERAVARAMDQTWTAHGGDFAIPPPPLDVDPTLPPDPSAAQAAAVARGAHLVEARYGCIECHGADFGGGTMIDDPLIGSLRGPNLTLGRGGVTAGYTAADWDRKVRHGVRPDGRSGWMPSDDYVRMSDRELGDIVTYLRSLPPVDREVPPVHFGPLGKVLVATGQLPIAAARIPTVDHHPAEPPATADTVDFGDHLLAVCTGCHRANLEGGPIPGGAPDWRPAANLSPHADGLAAWTRDDFVRAMRTGVRPDGSAFGVPMAMMVPYGARSTDTELHAMWTALQARPAVPDGR